jgi:aminopeptidase N
MELFMFRHTCALFGCATFVAAAAGVAGADSPYSFDATHGLLPKNVVPIAYQIALVPDLAKRVTAGHETVRIAVRAATKTVVFDTLEITVSRATLGSQFGTPAIVTDRKAQRTTLTFPKTVGPGTYALRLDFAGKIGTQPEGLFVQPYTTASGKKEEMLATQFESTDARRMFPSWDEPAFRATYRLSVTVPKDFVAVSNMPVASVAPSGERKTVTFERTPKMSTYLVVLCAGRFASISASVDGIRVSVVTPRDRIAQARYALSSATELLAYYDEYYGYKFPLPKLDLIDVPAGFPGAMENWGGITFTESDLLFDPKIEPESAKIDIFETIAHEMSHQWTGDLVTMDWWSGLWLNESFADWMETKASDHFNPQWHLWDTVEGDTEFAMHSDQQTSAHPIEQRIDDDKQASSTFDELTYQKGGAVIRMVEQYLGEETFRDGVRAYVKAHAYSNATAADLWSGLSGAAHQDVGALAGAFIATPGVPLVNVTTSCAAGRRTISLSQQRFLVEPGATSTQAWTIPVGISVAGKISYTMLAGKTATADGGACDAPFVVNAGGAGYFRTHLDDADASAAIAHLGDLTVAERARFIGDTNASVLAGATDPKQLVAAVAAVKPDDALTVWSAVQSSLREISDLEAGQSGLANFDAYRVRVLSPVLARLGWDAKPSDDANTPALRSDLIESLAYSGDSATILEAKSRFAKFLADPSSLAPGLREPVLTAAGIFADRPAWEALHKLFRAAKSPVEAQQYAEALWSARDPELAARNLAMATNGEIPPELGGILPYEDIVIVAVRGRCPDAAWSYFRAHATEMGSKVSEVLRPFVVAQIAPLFWNSAPKDQLDGYIDATPNLPPPLAAKAKHQIDVSLAERAALLPAIDATVAPKTAGR